MSPVEQFGPTPAGGDRSVATFRDASGAEVPQEQATEVVIEEFAGPFSLGHTYGSVNGPAEPVLPDPESEEWTVQATTVAELLAECRLDALPVAEQRQHVGQMLILPSWPKAPAALQAEVAAWLVSTRPAPAGR